MTFINSFFYYYFSYGKNLMEWLNIEYIIYICIYYGSY